MLPKAFDGVEVGTVRRKVDRFEVMPVESLDLALAGIVENQHTPSTGSRLRFLCHRVENPWKTAPSQWGMIGLTSLPLLGWTARRTIFRTCLPNCP